MDELWDHVNAGIYTLQLKIAIDSLQVEENIRHYYNNDGSITVTSGFRNWQCNYNNTGSARSLHMRGRAIDAQTSNTSTVYNGLYNEFKGSSSYPSDSGVLWISNVYGTSASLSGAYELEKMEGVTNPWIHLSLYPGYSADY
ncbi:MAG: hypothetical protein IKR93_02615 [Firmicutes bacterium]|nr:hypothetical protein [Bacillota bacterium]